MAITETLEDFYRHKFAGTPADVQREIGDFNVFVIEKSMTPQAEVPYARRDFYKICLVTGDNLYHYADKTLHVKGHSLIFFNPNVPYRWEMLGEDNQGYYCIFKEAFFMEKLRSNLGDLPMFAIGGKPSYILDEQQCDFVSHIFRKMLDEIGSDYKFKQDLLVSYVTELIHYALKMEATETLHHQVNANARITSIFSELLERQFPIDAASQRFTMRSPKDYADQLFVHINHLNRAVKETTGKTTSTLISTRVANEAKALLKHTNWSIAEIGYALGFEEPAHFNHFFRKHAEVSPSAFRSL